MASIRESKGVALQYVDEHQFLPDYVKPLIKDLVVKHFQQLSGTIGTIELAVRRTEDEIRKKRTARPKKAAKKGRRR